MDHFRLLNLLCFLFTCEQVIGQAYYAKIYKHSENDTSCVLLEETYLPNYKGLEHVKDIGPVRTNIVPAIQIPEGGGHHDTQFPSRIIQIYAKSKQLLKANLKSQCEEITSASTSSNSLSSSLRYRRDDSEEQRQRPQPEIRKMVDSGDPLNRIDVVFMGDGYTREERDKFFADISRYIQDMFEGVTFQSYLPLFNIWAIYVESEESGIGYDGPKKTPFKLYRQKGTLRAVFTKNPEYAREVCKMTGPYACDFPSLVGNDDFYGGLGGEFVIVTSSNETGKIVLRHEMGHNFLDAGEEYDNGYAYFGVNAAHTVNSLRWSHWLSGEKRREEKATYRILSYPWKDLAEGPVNYTFASNGGYSRWQLTLSVTAAGHEDAVEFLLDGKPLPWTTTGSNDRSFYTWTGNEGFSFGLHKFSIRSKSPSTNAKVPQMICSLALHEFGNEDEYHIDNNYVSAYPTWNFLRKKSYRPTNAGCLMRNMTHERFCPVCQEGMWINFLSEVSLIDDIVISEQQLDSEGTRRVSVKTLQLGQFRPSYQRKEGEFIEITWSKNGQLQKSLANQQEIFATRGNWTVRVTFETPEVRRDPYGVLNSKRSFEIL